MKNKIFLAIILLTPILVVTFSSLFFTYGYSPEGTRNNGVFFKSYFNFEQFNQNDNEKMIEFEDGKWVMAVYITDPEKSSNSLYLMRQLNVALNRDIYKVKRVAFYSNKLIKDGIDNLINEYPRTELVDDKNGVLLKFLVQYLERTIQSFMIVILISKPLLIVYFLKLTVLCPLI